MSKTWPKSIITGLFKVSTLRTVRVDDNKVISNGDFKADFCLSPKISKNL